MQQLKELLETAVSLTKFDMGQVQIRPEGTRSSYAGRPGEVIRLGEFCTIVNSNSWNDEFISAQSAKLLVPEEPYSQLYGYLHDLLDEYIDSNTDRVGHAFPVNGRNSYVYSSFEANGLDKSAFVSEVGDIAYALVRGAAVLGAERVIDLVSGWLEGAPVEYSTSTLIGELYIEEPIVPLDGVYISPLPRSSNKLPGNLPRLGGLSKQDYMGRTVASLRTCAKPAFFHPDNLKGVKIATASGLGFPQVCTALSLVQNTHIEARFYWNDYLELSALCLSPSLDTWSFSNSGNSSSLPVGTALEFDFENDEKIVVLPDESISNIDPEELRDTIEAVADVNSRELNLAIERWSRSKRSMSRLEDSFIDLRIALEALFLKDFTNEYSQEMRFRLALFGAWYLGADVQERQTIRKTLRDAYDSASGVVHGGDLKGDKESHEADRELLSSAQDLCRRGILKLIRKGMPSSEDWGNLILGSDLESCEKP